MTASRVAIAAPSDATPGAGGDAPPVPLRRNRDFQRLWLSQAFSAAGTRATAVAFPLLVLAITGSPAKAGLIAAAQTVPLMVWYLPAGALADRLGGRRLMLWAEGIRAVAFATVVVAIALDHVSLIHLAAVAMVEGSMLALFQMAEHAVLPHLVPDEQLATAVAQNQAREEGAELLGRPLGGLLFGVARFWPFAADVATYVVSWWLIHRIRPIAAAPSAADQPRGVAGLRDGVTWLLRQPFLRTMTVVLGITNMLFQAVVLVMIVRAEQLGTAPWLTGVMFGMFGLGAIVGSLITPLIERTYRPRTIVVAALWFWAATVAMMALAPSAIVLGVIGGITTLSGPPLNVTFAVQKYAMTPAAMRARTQGAVRIVANGALPLGSIIGGVLAARLGGASAFLVIAAVLGLVAVVATLARSIGMTVATKGEHR